MKVMVATDGRAHSDKAVQCGFSYSKAFKAKLYVLYVIAPNGEETKGRELKNAMKALEHAKSRGAEEGVEVVTLMEAGDPSKVIVDVTDEIEADVLVVGSSPKAGGLHLMSKSVMETCVKHAPCTVIVAR